MARPLVAEINLSALQHNYQLATQLMPAQRSLAVIKANAYGHGAVEVAKALQKLAPAFAVACLEEALELRQAGIQQPLVLLGGFFTPDELPLIALNNCQPVIHSFWQLKALANYFNQTVSSKKAPLTLWLKIDTGMHRLGFDINQIEEALAKLARFPQIKKIILTSHLAQADIASASAQQLTHQQVKLLENLSQRYARVFSLTNSAGSLNQLSPNQGFQRLGIMLYGLNPLGPSENTPAIDLAKQLQPVMTLKTRLISLRKLAANEVLGYGGRYTTNKPSLIGVAACGYGDGYPRQMQDGAPVLVNNQLASLAGRVSMDLITLNLNNCPNAKIGDEVVLWGNNPTANEVATYCDTISYTLVTGLMPRVKKVYLTD